MTVMDGSGDTPCQWCDGSGEANNPLNADPAVGLRDWHPPVLCPRCKGTGKDPDDGSDYWYLCFECGSMTVVRAWSFWKRDIDGDGDLIPAEDGDMDPICRCPTCGWDHVDDDSNPGIADGTRADVEAERKRALADWGDHWDEHWAEVARGG